MKNKPDQVEPEYPSWGQGPMVQSEDTVEDDGTVVGPPSFGNAVQQGSCYECQAL